MIPELGHFALILAFFAACFQTLTPCLTLYQPRTLWNELSWRFAILQWLGLLCCFAALEYALLTNDFSVLYVAQNSSTQLPTFYRFSALWAAHEGSVLLWIFLLSAWSIFITIIYQQRFSSFLKAQLLGIVGFINAGLLLFLLTTSNPFRRLLPDFPLQGQDLNPLLQDIGLAIHPPMLYVGYVGFGMVFAFALVGMINRCFDQNWLRIMRGITSLAFSFLTLGITLGSWWAYRELGWGGWWFWDPVENASFLPWLTGAALLHLLILTEKRGIYLGWMVLLTICAFALSLMGTFLVRSGILTSVHAFANDPGRGVFLLIFLLVVMVGSLGLYAWRLPTLVNEPQPSTYASYSRESLLLFNNVLLMTAMVTILLGTLYPLILDVLHLGKISVGAPYFTIVFAPIMLIVLGLMTIVPFCDWKQGNYQRLRLSLMGLVAMSVLMLVFCGLWHMSWSPLAFLGIVLAGWVLFTTLESMVLTVIRSIGLNALLPKMGMWLAHTGVAICALGIVLTSSLSVEQDVRMMPGDTTTVGPYQFYFVGLYDLKGSNFTGVQANFKVSQQGKRIAILTAEKRLYTIQTMGFTKAAILPGFWRDLYIALGEPLTKNVDGPWAIRLYYKPFVRWLWLGGVLILLGGLCSAMVGLRRSIDNGNCKTIS